MVSTYTTGQLKLEKPGNGDYVDTWSTPINANFDVTDVSSVTVALTSSPVTLSDSQGKSQFIKLTGTISAGITITFPNNRGFYIVDDQTTGAFTVTLAGAGGGSTVATIQSGVIAVWTYDGSDMKRVSQPYNSNLTTWAAKTVPSGTVVGTTDTQVLTGKSIAASQLTSATLGSQVGFGATSYSLGGISSGTVTPDPANGNFQHYTNGGAHTLAPPSAVCSLIIQVLNNANAGAITTSGFTIVQGDSLTTTNTNKFQLCIIKSNDYSSLTVVALQ